LIIYRHYRVDLIEIQLSQLAVFGFNRTEASVIQAVADGDPTVVVAIDYQNGECLLINFIQARLCLSLL